MKKNLLVFSLVMLSLFTLIISPVVVKADNNSKPSESDFVGNLTCGGSAVQDGNIVRGIRFHENLPKFTNSLYDILKIATPVIIIITGMLDVLKAVSAQKEDEMKKAQKKFLNRLLAGVVVFLVFMIIETLIAVLVPDDEKNAMNCVKCFLNDYTACQKVGTVSTSNAGTNNNNNNNNNNSQGGSTTHESSSGTTHGGGGGKF